MNVAKFQIMQNTQSKVMICDHHPIFRAGLKNILFSINGVQVIGEVAHGKDLMECVIQSVPDILLIETRMPGIDLVNVTKEIRKIFPHCKIVALASHEQEHILAEMFASGSHGYILKNSSELEIEAMIRIVNKGRAYYSGHGSDTSSKYPGNPYRHYVVFTEREKEIIRLICEDYTSKQIANALFLSKRTIEGHRSRIMCKMGVRSIAKASIYAIQSGLCNPESM
jgi:DNA-binding NarL/FixJ family response regulator